MPWITADMCHPNVQSGTGEALIERMFGTQLRAIDVAVDSTQWFQCRQGGGNVPRSKITGVPNLVAAGKKLGNSRVEVPVGVRDQANRFQGNEGPPPAGHACF